MRDGEGEGEVLEEAEQQSSQHLLTSINSQAEENTTPNSNRDPPQPAGSSLTIQQQDTETENLGNIEEVLKMTMPPHTSGDFASMTSLDSLNIKPSNESSAVEISLKLVEEKQGQAVRQADTPAGRILSPLSLKELVSGLGA